ncbi:MAG: TonB-dependent receptor [Polaribacter sp.]|uniref:SusC/RagA family TonB-linked outer membrane protein n=1 Tax=Polaribacter sp. TaxID=1920175 RepID=UPI0032670445
MSKNILIKKISTCLFLLASLFTFAQQKVSGTVTDASNKYGLPEVSIQVKGTTIGTTTDFDGNYSIEAPSSESILVFRYLGYAIQEIKVGNNKTINVALVEDASALDEIVVVGYGARKKSDVTGSVSSVKAEELNAFPVLNAAQAIQGRAAGVAIQSNNGGEPGAPINIQIRGNTSINASSAPLIVVDGFVGATMPQAGDIKSIEILKDASATAIYGSQGANGVVMVTTKVGRSGQMNFEINSTHSVQTTSNRLDLLNASDFIDYRNQVLANQGSTVAYTDGGYDTDWQDEIYRAGSTTNHQFSFSGGTDKANYYASATYFKQEGVLINSAYERMSFLTNINAQLTDKFKVGLNLTGNLSEKNGVATQSDGSGSVGNDDVITLAMRFAPDLSIYDDAGGFEAVRSYGAGDIDNPWAVATQREDDTEINEFRVNLYGDYEIIEGLNFKTTLGLSQKNTFRGRYIPRTLTVSDAGSYGRGIMEEDDKSSLLTESFLTYKKEVGKGVLSLLAGVSYQKKTDKGFYTEGTGTISDSFSYYGLWTATDVINSSNGETYLKEKEIQSQFGRVNYDYDDKYLITATVRRDGASNFAANEKYAIFPSAALGWKVSNEKFLVNNETISNLKLRVSYGVTGNPGIDAYESLASLESLYASNGGNTVFAFTPYQPANPDLKWESSYQANFGFDLGLLDNKIILSADYYNIDTKDIIMADQSIPQIAGFLNSEILANVGEVNNKGVDISLNTRNITNDDFSWTTDVVFSKNKNTVVSLINGIDFFSSGQPSYLGSENTSILREGEEVGLFWGYDYAGVYDGGTLPTGTVTNAGAVAGDPLFYDVADKDGNTNGALGSEDRKIIGNPNPDFTWGITNNFKYKNWDMNIFFQGSQGGEIFNLNNSVLNNGDSNTTYEYFNNAYSSSNTNTDQPRVGNNSDRELSSRFVEDGSYVRLKNISCRL